MSGPGQHNLLSTVAKGRDAPRKPGQFDQAWAAAPNLVAPPRRQHVVLTNQTTWGLRRVRRSLDGKPWD